eukprot:COSAG02_NODE_5479_length_4291_cov_5.207777_2_plen_549_part_00
MDDTQPRAPTSTSGGKYCSKTSGSTPEGVPPRAPSNAPELLGRLAASVEPESEPACEPEPELEPQSESVEEDETMALVIDNGISTIKVGFVGDDVPVATFPAVIGRGRHVYRLVGMDQTDFWVGEEALAKRGVLVLRYPMDSLGMVTSWEDMEHLWHHAFYNEARVPPEETPVLMTEAILNPKANRERMIQICFENLIVPGFYVCTRAYLALHAAGRTTGVVLQVSDGEPYAIPFLEGSAIVHGVLAIRCMKGSDLNHFLGKLLRERGLSLTGGSDISQTFDQIKLQLGYVALDPVAEMQKPERWTTALEKALQMLAFTKGFHDHRSSVSDIESDIVQAVSDHLRHDISAKFTLSTEPHPIRLSSERFRFAEALFDPTLICGKDYAEKLDHDDHMRGDAFHGGIHELVYNSVRSCAAEIRSKLLRNIVCQGGHARLPGFEKRLELEVGRLVTERGLGSQPLQNPSWLLRAAEGSDGSQLSEKDTGSTANSDDQRSPKIEVVGAWQHSAFVGGSMLACMELPCHGRDRLRWISKEEYEEEGPVLVHQYC